MAKNTKLVAENRDRDIKHLGVVEVDGEKYSMTLGSSDDRGMAYDHASEFKPPRSDKAINEKTGEPTDLTSEIWDAFMNSKAVQGWVEENSITVHPKA